MSIGLKEVFDSVFEGLKVDLRLARLIDRYQAGYVHQSTEYVEFFGSNLIGVHAIRFRDSDVKRFYDMLAVDQDFLTKAVRTVTTIEHDYEVSGDVFNLTCMYLIHRALTSAQLSPTQKKITAHNAALIFFYRCIAIRQSYVFRYPCDPKIAQAAYANLSNKYLIKRVGSWYEVMEYRAKAFLEDPKLHLDNLAKFTDDQTVVYAINDGQGRIRDLYKNYYNEFKNVHAQGDSIGVSSLTYMDAEGEETLRENLGSIETTVNDIRQLLSDEKGFVKEELFEIVLKTNTNTSAKLLRQVLVWLTQAYARHDLRQKVDDFASTIVVQSFDFMTKDMDLKHQRDYAYILVTLKRLYLSTRTSDPDVLRIREVGEGLLRRFDPKMSTSLLTATRTAVILYVSLRAIVKLS